MEGTISSLVGRGRAERAVIRRGPLASRTRLRSHRTRDWVFTSRKQIPIYFAMLAPVLIYTTPICPYCVRAKQLLTKKGATFREIDVSNDPTTRAYLVEATGQRTVPQIFIDGKSIGGCDDMIALDRQGKLDELLSRALAKHVE